MSNFEEMSNQELHSKLLEFGYQNMPVTQTTRKLIIRKLTNHVEGAAGGGAAKGKSRRETIHQVMKYSSDEDTTKAEKKATASEEAAAAKAKKSRRATVGGDKLSQTVPIAMSTPEPKTSSRKSGRITPLGVSKTVKTAFEPENEIIINEESDEDLPLIVQKTKRRTSKSRSKSPSPLSKGQTITTSYINVVEKKTIPEVTEMDVDSDEPMVIDEDVVEMPRPEIIKEKKRSVSRASTNEPVSSTSRQTLFRQTVAPKEKTPEVEPFEAPYLSEFAKRLSILTAEHNREASVTRRSMAAPIQKQYRPSEYYNRRETFAGRPQPQKQADNGIRESLYAVLTALDRKFYIRKILFYTIIVLAVIFVYVFFFM